MLNFTAENGRAARLFKAAAIVCLVAVFTIAAVQAVHMHADFSAAQTGTLDSHCSLCMVSHCVLGPQHSHVLVLPARVVFSARVVQAPQISSTRIFDRFVRPPPAG